MERQYRSIVWRFYAFEFLSGFHFFSAVLVPFFTDWGGTTLAVAQALQSWFTFCIFLLEIPTGVIADRVGRKHSVALGSLILVPATLIYGSIPHIWAFALGEFLFACGVALTSGADKALLYDSLKSMGKEEQSTIIWGRARSISLLGIALAAPIGGVMAQYWGVNAPMFLTSVPAFLAAIVVWTIPEPKVEKKAEDESMNYFRFAMEGMKYLRNHKILLRWTLNSTIVGGAAYFVIWYYQPVLKNLGYPLAWYGFAHTYLVVTEVIVSSQYQFLKKLIGSPKRFFALSAILTSIGFLGVALFPDYKTFALFMLFAGGFGLTRGELMGAEMNKHIESHNRATVHSCASMIRRIVQAILNIVAGISASYSLPLTLFAIALIALLSFLFPLNGEEEKKKE